jgi:hypothetical protein
MPESTTGASTISYQTDIRPLFREKDQRAMLSKFDLWSYEDVSTRADAIAARLRRDDAV